MKPISRLGLGCVTFGREIDEKKSFELMDYALVNGITLFDTAAAYGAGASERIVGAWMKVNAEAARTLTVATKILPPYTPQNIEIGVEQSLARLQTDCIDLLYLHHWHASAEYFGILMVLDDLVRKGKLRKLGVSNFSAQQIQNIATVQAEAGLAPFQFAQNNHNFAVSEVTNEFYHVCKQLQIAIVGYSPLGAGFLTGKYAAGLEKDSRFARIPGHQQIYFNDTGQSRLARLQKVAKKTGYSTMQLALAWALHHQKVDSVLIGARKKEHIDQALTAFAFDAPNVLRELEE